MTVSLNMLHSYLVKIDKPILHGSMCLYESVELILLIIASYLLTHSRMQISLHVQLLIYVYMYTVHASMQYSTIFMAVKIDNIFAQNMICVYTSRQPQSKF